MKYRGYDIIAEVAVNYWCDIEVDEQRERVDFVNVICDGGVDRHNITGYVVVDETMNDFLQIPEGFDYSIFDGPRPESVYAPYPPYDGHVTDPPYAATLEDAKKIIDHLREIDPASHPTG
jgi:hypothetical protein